MSGSAALPHLCLEEVDHPHLLLVRARDGISIDSDRPESACALFFFLVSPTADPGLHLRILAQLAGRIDQSGFMADWLGAATEQQLKEALFRDERMLALRLGAGRPSGELIGAKLSEVSLPSGTLIAMIRRDEELIIPSGATTLLEDDRLTVIGRPDGIGELRARYGDVVTADS